MDTNEIIARLRHMVRIGDAMNACRTESNNVLAAAADLLEAQQAKIDRLMLEHCPGEREATARRLMRQATTAMDSANVGGWICDEIDRWLGTEQHPPGGDHD